MSERNLQLHLQELNPVHAKFAVFCGEWSTGTLAHSGTLVFDSQTWKADLKALAEACQAYAEHEEPQP